MGYHGFRPYRNRNNPGDGPPKWGLGRMGRLVIALTVVAGIVIALMIMATRPGDASDGEASPATPQQPSPSTNLVRVGGRVMLPEHGLAVTFPPQWVWVHYTGQDVEWTVDRVADLKGRSFATQTRHLFEDPILEAPVFATPGPDQWCTLFVYPTNLTLDAMAANDRRAFGDAEDADFGQPGSDVTAPDVTFTDVSLPAGAAYRIDWALADTTGVRLAASDYTIKRDGTAVVFGCATEGEMPPEDRWLSIADSIEFLPADD